MSLRDPLEAAQELPSIVSIAIQKTEIGATSKKHFNILYMASRFPGTQTKVINMASYNYLGFAQAEGPCADAAERSIDEHGLSVCSFPQERGKMASYSLTYLLFSRRHNLSTPSRGLSLRVPRRGRCHLFQHGVCHEFLEHCGFGW